MRFPTRRICSVVIPRAGGAGGVCAHSSASLTAGASSGGTAFGDFPAARFFLGGIHGLRSWADSILDAAPEALLESPVTEMSVMETQKRRWRPIVHHHRHHI